MIPIIPKQTLESAWMAGRDAALNGVNEENCHFSYFSNPELTAAWESGNKSGKWEKEQTFSPRPGGER